MLVAPGKGVSPPIAVPVAMTMTARFHGERSFIAPPSGSMLGHVNRVLCRRALIKSEIDKSKHEGAPRLKEGCSRTAEMDRQPARRDLDGLRDRRPGFI